MARITEEPRSLGAKVGVVAPKVAARADLAGPVSRVDPASPAGPEALVGLGALGDLEVETSS